MSKKTLLSYDHANMTVASASLAERLSAAQQVLLENPPAFFSLPSNKEIAAIKKLGAVTAKKFRTLIVVGIGGSDLGARTLVSALQERGRGMEIRFIGANTDPDEIGDLLAAVDLKKCVINIVSKSGGTIEPMATFLLLREKLIAKVGQKNHAKHVIATTDPRDGALRAIAEREGYATLEIPAAIGGRFCVFTAAALFPAACAGIDINKLAAGAAAAKKDLLTIDAEKNVALMFAGLQHDAYRQKRRVTVLMPYAERLRGLAFWFRQLWAESLGKQLDRGGKVVNHGLTPVAALGATDQHSQIQLYNEGPDDKTVTFIEVDAFREKLRVPKAFADMPAVAAMTGHSFEKIIHAERLATAQALAMNGRANGTLHIPKISPETIGSLMFAFMAATAALGELLDIDVYDQPGVEAGKKAMMDLLGT